MEHTSDRFLDILREKGVAISRKYSLPRGIIFLLDLAVVFLAFLAAGALRFNFDLEEIRIAEYTNQAFVSVAVYALFLIVFKSYRDLIRHTTLNDITNILKANTFAFVVLLLISGLGRSSGWRPALIIPYSILIIHYVLATAVHAVERIMVKLTFEYVNAPRDDKKNVIIFGAGILGAAVKQIIESDHFSVYRIAGYIDDDRKLRGKTISHHPIWSFGVLDKRFVKDEKISTIILAVNKFPQERKAMVIRKALSLDLEVLEVPSADSWLQGKFSMNQLHRVRPEDLLGRPPIQMNTERIFQGLIGKTILVTGAAGSIGSELVRQILRFGTVRLILVDQAETPLFFLGAELKKNPAGTFFKTLIADITNSELMERIFVTWRPDIVFHAAAYKHVPMMEENPHEALRVNCGGTKVVADLAGRYGVEKFIMISTDKAVNPTNVMGASKRLCELYVQTLCKNRQCTTSFVTTRFGNVLGSNGSVIPIFRKQIENGGPVTITHRDIKRYFMTIPEACQLVLEAAFMGNGGEIFVFDMGSLVSIYDLAEQMIKLSGLVPGKDIKIEVTGLRPGEKLYEELLTDSEKTSETYHSKIMIAHNGHKIPSDLEDQINELLAGLYSKSNEEIVARLQELLPEYRQEPQV